jgi:ribonucleoside-diphosphate reductase alpha chain
MDNVIDLNYYPIAQAQVTNKKYRAVGLGSSGYHQMLAQSAIQWESDDHLSKADEVYEKANYYAIKASMQNAIEKGTYKMFEGSEWQTGEYFDSREYTTGTRETHIPAEKWQELKEQVAKNGVRNAWMFAIAPTGLNIGPATA